MAIFRCKTCGGQLEITEGETVCKCEYCGNTQTLPITDEIIEEKAYHEENEATTWETSDLRKYLNEVFYEEFSDTEKTMISEINIKNKNNSEYNTNGGNDTVDKIFLLSIDDVNNYYMSDKDRVANINGRALWWWLRSPGCEQDTAAIVTPKGEIYTKGNANSNKIGVRPAIWIHFDDSKE